MQERNAQTIVGPNGTASVHLTLAVCDYEHVREISQGLVRADGITLTPLIFPSIEEITFRWPSGVPHEGDAAVSFGPVIDDVPHTWQFARHVPTDRHKIAVAMRRLGGPDLDLLALAETAPTATLI